MKLLSIFLKLSDIFYHDQLCSFTETKWKFKLHRRYINDVSEFAKIMIINSLVSASVPLAAIGQSSFSKSQPGNVAQNYLKVGNCSIARVIFTCFIYYLFVI